MVALSFALRRLGWCGIGLYAVAASAAASASAIPTALWIPLVGQGHDHGRWLLISAEHRVLRDDLKAVFGFRSSAKGVLPAPAQAMDGRWGYLDVQGQWVHPPVFDAARSFSDEDGLGRVQQNGRWGFIGTDLKMRIAPTWPDVSPFYNGRAAVQDASKKWGVIDTAGNLVVQPKYRVIGPYARNGLARAGAPDGHWSYIDPQGNTRISLGQNLPLDFGAFDVAPAEKNDQWGLINAQGEWVLKPSLDSIDWFQAPGVAMFRRKHKRGYINLQGQEVIVAGEHSRLVRQGLVRVEQGRHSFVDTKGQGAIADRFEWVADFPTQGATIGRKDNAWGLLDAKGQWQGVGASREPWLVGPQSLKPIQGGLRVWLHAGQAIEWKNDAGQTVYRLTEKSDAAGKSHVWTLHAGDQPIWTSPPQSSRLDLVPFLEPQPEDLIALTDKRLVAEAKRLLSAPARRFAPYSLVFSERRDAYDLDGLDEDEEERIAAGGFTSLAETYVSEEQWGQFYYLGDQRHSVFNRMAAQACQTLEAVLGKPQPITKLENRYWQGFVKHCVWQQGDRQLMVLSFHETGDGEFEEQLALVMLAPS